MNLAFLLISIKFEIDLYIVCLGFNFKNKNFALRSHGVKEKNRFAIMDSVMDVSDKFS